MRSYWFPRTLFSLIAAIAWIVIFVGILIAVASGASAGKYGGGGAALFAILPGLGITLAGMFILVHVQIGRAGVDTAEYTQQMLKISRDQLEVSRQALSSGNPTPKVFASPKDKSTSPRKRASFFGERKNLKQVNQQASESMTSFEKQVKYRGYAIISDGTSLRVDHVEFDQLDHAKAHIDLILQKDELEAAVEELSTIKTPRLDPIQSTPDPMRLQTGAPESTLKAKRQEPTFE